MKGEHVVRELDAARTGELDVHESGPVLAHLGSCRACTSSLAEIERMAAGLRTLRTGAPPGLADRVLARLGDHYGCVATELGPVWVGFSQRGVTLVHLGAADAQLLERLYERRLGRRPRPGEVPERYARAIRRAAAGDPVGTVPVDLSGVPAFEREVLARLSRIPRGEVRPYAWLAREAGRPKAVRAVGNALARNPVPLLLPCHRVVPSSGGIGSYVFGAALKSAVLQREGAPVGELRELATRGVRYLGCTSTHIYCLPSCRDIRRAHTGNQVPFQSEQAALARGYRPCRHCRPSAVAA